MYGTSDAMVVPFAQEVGNHNIGTDGQADKKVDEQIDGFFNALLNEESSPQNNDISPE